MVGYIGGRAKRRRRNFILFFALLFFVLIVYYLLPLLKLSDVKPTDNLLPSEQEIISPEIKTTIEELELKLFDKEQKIIFRNKQIEKLKDEIKALSFENQNFLESNKVFEKKINSSLSIENLIKEKDQLIKKIKKDQLNELKKLKDTISKIKLENKNLLQIIEKNNDDTDSLNKQLKSIFSKNLKLKNFNEERKIKIEELENFIEEQNLIIQLLKDNNPHG